MKFEMNVPTLVGSNSVCDFYIEKCSKLWYVLATSKGNTNLAVDRKALAGFTTKRGAFSCVESWKSWMK